MSVRQSVEVLKARSLLIKLSLELEGPKTIQDLEFLLLTFMSVFAQRLPSSMGEVFFGFGGWVRRFGCPFFGLRVQEGHDFYFFRGGGEGVGVGI
jgi:hypothetical protein